MPLKYKVNVLEALKDKGYSTYKLRAENILSEGTIQNLRQYKPISWTNIEKLCALLDCQPNDFLISIDED